MSVDHVEILVEEPSMETALRLLLPKMIEDVSFKIYPHQCKQDLLANLPDRLRGYRRWIPESWRIVVLLDCDTEDCRQLKDRLEQIASSAGLKTKSTVQVNPYVVVNRLAIEELEAWYFGDWAAVQSAYPHVSQTIPLKAKYRDPDAIKGGTWEAFEKILKRAGYFSGGLRKIEAARAIAQYMTPEINSSKSFQVFRSCLQEMALERENH
ncbi:MAG: DUF4276 family protein [Deltaproteobacteria bacterium]|nr:DUF4276 family protein [Deltaproteobacteria bacterium]